MGDIMSELFYDDVAERAVIACAFAGASPRSLEVSSDDFTDSGRRAIWEALLAVDAEGGKIEYVSVLSHLERKYPGRISMGRLIDSRVPYGRDNPTDAAQYADSVINLSRRRKLRDAFMMAHASEEPDPEKALATAMEVVNRSMSERGGEVGRGAADGIVAMMKSIGKMGQGLYGLSTGFQTINSAIGGLAPGDVSVLAGATGTGKTALALQIAYHVSLGNPVLYFSGEMLDEDLWLRNTCRLAKVSLALLRREKTGTKVAEMVREASEASIKSQMRIVHSNLELGSVAAKIQKFRADYGAGLVVIDHLDHVTTDDESRVQALATIMRVLKSTALACELPMIVVSQFNRNFDATHRPTMFNLKGGSSIEQYADSIWLLCEKEDPLIPGEEHPRVWMRLQIEKNRRGPVGDIRMVFDPMYTSFTDGKLLGEGWQ